jgi:hypothetical protein
VSEREEREAFEKWFTLGRPVTLVRKGEKYGYLPVTIAWQAWQARAALNDATVPESDHTPSSRAASEPVAQTDTA